jgi:hypothetical protein
MKHLSPNTDGVCIEVSGSTRGFTVSDTFSMKKVVFCVSMKSLYWPTTVLPELELGTK